MTTLADDERLFHDSVYEFADQEIRPLVRQMDEEAQDPARAHRPPVRARRHGHRDPRVETAAPAARSFTRCSPSRRSRASIRRSASSSTSRTRSSSTRCFAGAATRRSRRCLPRLAQTSVGAYALSEAGSGSDAFALTTRATERGDGFAITGRKLWITNGNEADVFIVFATVNPEAGYRGITAFVVERGTPGFTVGKKEDKLGIRASSTCELIFEDCQVPRANVLGETGKGYKVAIETLNEGRIGIGAQMIGLAQGALDHTIRYTKERKQFGSAIAEFQGVQFQIARAATELEAARLLVYNAARLRDAGQPFLREAAMCKLFSSEVAERVDVAGGQPVRRLRIREGLPGREAVSRRQDRADLRRHVQPAAADDRQADPGVGGSGSRWLVAGTRACYQLPATSHQPLQ